MEKQKGRCIDMDIKAQITKITETLTKDKTLYELFQKEPVKALEKITGLDLPDEIVQQLIDGVKAKLTADKLKNVAEGALGALKKVF